MCDETHEGLAEEACGSEEFRMVMRLLALQVKHAMEAGSEEEQHRILDDLKQALDEAAAGKLVVTNGE